jgi:hypothetical protein
MKKSSLSVLALLTCGLAVGLLLLIPGVASSNDFETPLSNLDLVSTNLEAYTFAKLDARGHLDGHILYTGCYLPDQCFRVVDVKDPNNLVLLASPPVFDPIESPAPRLGQPVGSPEYKTWFSTDPKYANLPSKSPCGDWKPGGPGWTDNPTCWDPGWNTHSHYVQENNKILVANQERYRTANQSKRASYAGLTIWDVRDPANPVFLTRYEFPKGPRLANGTYTQSGGVHHFYFDGRYVYGGTEYGPYTDETGAHPGFSDRIFFIVDLKDPRHPVEVGKWWVSGQRDDEPRDWIPQSSFNDPIWKNSAGTLTKKVGVHYVFVQGNRAYLSYHQEGMIILDVTDKSNPTFVGQLDYLVPAADRAPLASGAADLSPDDAKCAEMNPTKATYGIACGNTHAAKPVPGRSLLVVSDEYFSCPYGHVRIVDIKDETHPKVISHFWYPAQIDCGRNWGDDPRDTTPSAHLGTAKDSKLYWMAWYAYGLRGIDISDPENPVEAGHYFYRILDNSVTSVTYDIAFGPHGYLYVTDNVSGIRVLKYTGQGNAGK